MMGSENETASRIAFSQLERTPAAAVRAVGFALFRAWPFLFLPVIPQVRNAAESSHLEYLVSVYTLALSLLAFAMFSKRLHDAVRSRAFILAATGCLVASVAIPLLFEGGFGASSIAVAAVSGVLSGLGSAAFNLVWACVYRTARTSSIIVETPLALCVGTLLPMGAFAMPRLALVAVNLLLPCLIGACAFYLLVDRKADLPYRPLEVNASHFVAGTAVTLTGVAAVGGCVRNFFPLLVIDAGMGQVPYFASTCIGAAVLFGLFCKGDENYGKLYKAAVVVLAFSVVFAPVFPQSDILGCTVSTLGFSTFRMLTFITLLLIVKRNHLNYVVVVGFGQGLISLGEALGTSVAFVADLGSLGQAGVSLFVAVSVMIVLAAMMMSLDEKTIIKLVEQSEESASAESKPKEQPEQLKRPSFKDRCDQVASYYKLTPKETEIMLLMAKGYSGSAIQEKLVLSRSTVSTHQQHLYRKMGIHAKQEMLEIIDGEPLQ